MKELSANKLLEAIKSLRGEENKVLAELIRYLAEIYRRKAFAELGYSSLFSFSREALGYSEGAAWRRVSAAKLMLDMPELYGKISSGELSLCAIAEIARVQELDKRQALATLAAGKSKREVQSLVAEALPAEAKPKRVETIRTREVHASSEVLSLTPYFRDITALLPGKEPEAKREKVFTITLELTEREMGEIEELQKLLSARRVKDALVSAARKLANRHKRLKALREKRRQTNLTTKTVASPELSADRSPAQNTDKQTSAFPPVETRTTIKPSRYIPAGVRHAVEQRDKCQCTFVSAEGRRCSETSHLQLDHVVPFALGGESTLANLRLLCSMHNRFEAGEMFGHAAMQGIIRSNQLGRSANRSR